MNRNRNHFILSAAAAYLVTAYKAVVANDYQKVLPLDLQVATDAPEDYATLRMLADNGILKVTTAHSDKSIYGRDGNVAFRIMHDYGHILYNKAFTLGDEISLAQMQWDDFKQYIPAEWQHVCKVVYMADTVEQSIHEYHTGEFPTDQRAFVLGFLNNQLVLDFPARSA